METETEKLKKDDESITPQEYERRKRVRFEEHKKRARLKSAYFSSPSSSKGGARLTPPFIFILREKHGNTRKGKNRP